MAKRKKKSKSSSKLIYVVWFLSIVLLFLVVFIVGYYIGQDDTKPKHQTPVLKEAIKKEPAPAKEQKPKKEEILEDRLKDILKSEQNSTTLEQNISKADENITLKQKQEPLIDASHEIDSKALAEPIKREKIKLKTKARLAIVIDDVSTKTQVDNIKSLNIPLTMSFLPPSKERPNSNVLAQKEPFYMVHLPMEALHFNAEEPHTLRVNDSKEQILHRIEDIKKLFPNVKYINNHTGSKFTSDERAVENLVYALNVQKIEFLDSRTIASSKVPLVMKKYGKKYIARDIFLDHEQNKEYVKSQIKKAISFAKDHGSAVAIGHPHANTLAAIKELKSELNSVELVRIDKVYE